MRQYFILIPLLIMMSCRGDKEIQSIYPEANSITESVYASAIVSPAEQYLSRTTESGIIEDIYIVEGENIEKGQPLFKIETTPVLDNKIELATLNLEEAEANFSGQNNLLVNLEIEIKILEEKYKLDSVNYKRKLRLWQQDIGSKNELEKLQLEYSNSKRQLESAIKKYQQTKINLKNNLAKAKNTVITERSQLKNLVVKAEIDGVVYKLYKQLGEFISPQENFALIGNNTSYIIDMEIDESDITKINIGDTTLINLEAYQNDVFRAEVIRMSTIKDERTQTFNVEGKFIDLPKRLYNGLSGEANIIVDKRENVMTIPAEYLIGTNTVRTSEGIKQVKIGIKNLDFVEITEGLSSEELLLKPE